MRDGLEQRKIMQLFLQARKGNRTPLNDTITNAETNGIRMITPYTFRHFMATQVKGLREVTVDREQRSLWLGHGRKDATSWYESHHPEFLLEASLATTIILEKLDVLMKRNPISPKATTQVMQTKTTSKAA